ncbi:hypothetical protein SiH_2353 [Sulfolobus islandicus HVE10/4]|uniref:Uncharacterized protein n=1 Tax=Saccharolobus islandicus (strain HVE10/4) TaxID=930943 RepID=F0NLK1_SACI0|nr:hypothetical protein SiH_2353 [Sulfolobus islandicus HVE10/4]
MVRFSCPNNVFVASVVA